MKEIKEGTLEHFVDKVRLETRTRMMREHGKVKMYVSGKEIKFKDVHEIEEARLDEFSKVTMTETENRRHTIVQVGPKKQFLVSKSTKAITSMNRKEYYGTLETIDDWDWSGFWPVKKDAIWRNAGVSTGTIASNNKRTIFK